MDRYETEWDLVIKVNYGDTLKRFGAYVHGHAIDHDMAKLKTKIIKLFKFSPEAELVLTYTDEDGDIVALDDDDELHDAAVSQRLNPLRISVTLKTTAVAKSDSKAEPVGSTSAGSPQIHVQPWQVNYAVNESLKSLPEPLRGTLLKISNDFVSKAALSSPAFAEFLEYFSKLGLSNVSQPPQEPSEETLSAPRGGSTQPVDLNISYGPNVPNDPTPSLSILSRKNSVNPGPEYIHKQHESGATIQAVGTRTSALGVLNLDDPHASVDHSVNDLLTSIWTTNNQELEKGLEAHREGKAIVGAATVSALPTGQSLDQNLQNLETPGTFVPPCGLTDVLDNDSKQFPTSMASYGSQIAINAYDAPDHLDVLIPEVPFPGGSIPPVHPYRRSHSYHHSMLRTFHRGVRCDGCGMHPIMGPRFKSNVKEDYDLCGICFAEMGNEADYTRIDRAPYRSPRLLKELYNPHSRHRFSSPHAFHGCGTRPSKAKLESRFIQDVTVLDGTLMPPSTPFTKIWRMRNNGTTAWPCGTQLVWIGGHQLGNRGSVVLEILESGCHVDEELDVAVDFISPSRPGRYISYWRMASPSGQKFGQRVWVLIQVHLVDNSQANCAGNFHVDINLNLPPETIGQNGLGTIDVNVEPLDPVNNTVDELVKPFGNHVPVQNVEPSSVDVLLGANDGVVQPTPVVVPPSSYPIIDFPESSSNASAVVVGLPSVSVPDDNPVEQTLLKELEEMGFKQIDLNKEILRLNEYDLEQSVDDLCGFTEWDPLLQELQEMGFNDKEMNKKLLLKNGGSLKRVVLDLIARGKAE